MHSIWSDLLRFFVAFVSHWQGLVTGGAVTALIFTLERLTGKQLPKRTFVYIFVVTFALVAFFMAWRDEYGRAITLAQENIETKVRNDNLREDVRRFKETNETFQQERNSLLQQLKEKPKEIIRTVAGVSPATVPAITPEEPLRLRVWNYPGMHPLGNAPDAKTSTWIVAVSNKKLEAPVSFVLDYAGDIAMSRAVATPMVGTSITMGGASLIQGNKIVVSVQSPSINACVPIMMNIESRGAEVRVSSIQL